VGTSETWQKSQRKSCRHQNANLCENSTQDLVLDFPFEPKFNPNKNARQPSYGRLLNSILSCANGRIRCSNGRSLDRDWTERSTGRIKTIRSKTTKAFGTPCSHRLYTPNV